MSNEFPPHINDDQEFLLGQKVRLTAKSKIDLANTELGINPDNVLTVVEYDINNVDENGDTVVLTDENGNTSIDIAVWHLEKVLN